MIRFTVVPQRVRLPEDLVNEGDGDFFDMSLDHLCVAGFDGYWKRMNASWTRTLGWTTQELMARPLIEFCHPDDREATLSARRRLTRGVPLRGLTNRYRCADGTYRWFEWRSVSHVDRRLVYAVARDVTASVRTLASGVAHQVNNPLAYVMTNLEMIVEELGNMDAATMPARTAECVQMANEARHGAERIRTIVRGLMSLSRDGQERHAVVDVRRSVERSIEMTIDAIRPRAQVLEAYGALPPVEADEARLTQVFASLLVNAAQAIPEGDAAGNQIRVATSTDAAGRAVVEFRDTGPGIPEVVLPRIFEAFFTTKPIGVGMGLGLSICHAVVSGLGGRISAANHPSGGAVFRVVLPAATIAA